MSFLGRIRKDKDEGATSYPAGILRDKDAVVFWDAQDYPIHSGVDHESVFLEIKKTLSVCPKVSIHAYLNKTKLSEELLLDYEKAQIIIHDLSRGEKANWQIFVDIYMWKMRSDGFSNLFVLSKRFTEEDMFYYLELLKLEGYGVFLSDSGSNCKDILPSCSFLTSLFTKKQVDTPPAHDDDLTPKSLTFSTNSFTSTADFPSMPFCKYRFVETIVHLLMDDFPILEKGKDLLSLTENLKEALWNKGYIGYKVFCCHFLNDGAKLEYNYFPWGLKLHEYNNGEGFDKVLVDILRMAHARLCQPLNLVILSKNEKLRLDTTRFTEVTEFLNKYCNCNVVIAQIDELLQHVKTEENQSILKAQSVINYDPRVTWVKPRIGESFASY